MKLKTCCFSGHRSIPVQDRDRLQNALLETVKALVNEGYCYFGAGGALGFDTMAARTVLDLRRTNPKIKLILVLPCVSQADSWPPKDIATYKEILDQADKFVYTSQEYTKGCMFKRNRHLVDYSSACICYQTRASGGTAYTVNYAKRKGLRIINLAEKQA